MKFLKFLKCFLITIVLIFVAIIVIGLILPDSDEPAGDSAPVSEKETETATETEGTAKDSVINDDEPAGDSDPVSEKETETATETEGTAKDSVINDDETLHVTYRKIDNAVGLENAYYLYLTVENKTDTTVIITLADVSVNGEMVTALSGVPMKITAGNKSSNPFILPCNNTTSVTDIGSIQKISFSIKAYNDDMEIVSETEELTIEP